MTKREIQNERLWWSWVLMRAALQDYADALGDAKAKPKVATKQQRKAEKEAAWTQAA